MSLLEFDLAGLPRVGRFAEADAACTKASKKGPVMGPQRLPAPLSFQFEADDVSPIKTVRDHPAIFCS